MAKIIIAEDGNLRTEIPLNKKRLTIGRAAHNDVVIEHPGISSEHAVIQLQQSDFVLEDLGSTNGTKVNGQPIKRHFLQDGDQIHLAAYGMCFSVDSTISSNGTNAHPTSIYANDAPACIKVLSGVHADKRVLLNKSLITIGKPGIQVAAFVQDIEGYFLLHVEGERSPAVNGQSMTTTQHRLQNGDQVEIDGTKIRFLTTRD
ncbi:MAG: FHA domain-containing protein [Burkholderiales bacterium]|nr:FHA domain-containing protein [Burkholderiales bacterium]